jgi:flagellar hook protein FlgE
MLWGAFANSCGAMMAQSHSLNVIGQNIANVNTTGYKKVDDQFQTLLSESTARTNIFGVKAATRQMVDVQGPVLGTGRNIDVAINGEGFYILSPEITAPSADSDYSFTRDGNFQWTLDNASSSTGTTTRSTYDVQITSASNELLKRDQIQTSSGTQPAYLGTKDGSYLMGYAIDQTTGTTATSLSGIRTDPYVFGFGEATSSFTLRANIDANATTADPAVLSVPIYWSVDSPVPAQNGLSLSHIVAETLTVTFTPTTTANEWTLSMSAPNATAAPTLSTTTITFNGDGSLASPLNPSTLTIDISWNDVDFSTTVNDGSAVTTTTSTGTPDDSSITLDISGLTQFADQTQINSMTQNGVNNGTLVDSYFTNDGYFVGAYSNNTTQSLYQIPVATFEAPNQLGNISGTRFVMSELSGDMTIRTIGSNDEGLVTYTAGAVEQSNVSVEDEFTKMIITQKAYSLASKVFQTADQMSQTAGEMI